MTRPAFDALSARYGFSPGQVEYIDPMTMELAEVDEQICDPRADKIRMDAREEDGRRRAEERDRRMNPEWE
jgi:hypothetical protein